MRIPRAFTRRLLCIGMVAAQACSPEDEATNEGATPSTPIDPAAPSPSGNPQTPGGMQATPVAPGAPNPSSEAPPTPSLEPPPVSSGNGDGSLPGSDGSSETPPVVSPPASSCASPSSLAAGNAEFTIEQDGQRREYIVHVPPNLDPSVPVPLVVDMHGLTSSAGAQAGLSGWRAKADEEGFIVAHPQGLGNSWNGGELCCGSSQSRGVDDEGFIRAMVAQIEAEACIDTKRVYATGLSNGGAMSHLLACNAADLFAASAPVSMGNGTRPCQPSRPISVVMTRGTQDTLVSFNGGLFPSAQADFEQWAELNGCQGEPEQVDELCEAFTQCDAGVEVKLCALAAGHVLYDNRQGFSVPDTVWATFERQTLP
ncbi:MAG TPA: PHB depolymerase family esterase [Polyangiaceae bacterium]|nr:PHB depolymerase family esterase [Polyangiaceae bacterium]